MSENRTSSTNLVGLRLDRDCYYEQTRDPDPDDRWDRGNTSTSHYIQGISIVDTEVSDFNLENIKVGDVVYVIYAIYSTGDSFGNDTCGGFEVIIMNSNSDIATKNYDIIVKNQNNRDRGTVELTLDNGNIMSYYPPWNGYFENLEDLRLESYCVSMSFKNKYNF